MLTFLINQSRADLGLFDHVFCTGTDGEGDLRLLPEQENAASAMKALRAALQGILTPNTEFDLVIYQRFTPRNENDNFNERMRDILCQEMLFALQALSALRENLLEHAIKPNRVLFLLGENIQHKKSESRSTAAVFDTNSSALAGHLWTNYLYPALLNTENGPLPPCAVKALSAVLDGLEPTEALPDDVRNKCLKAIRHLYRNKLLYNEGALREYCPVRYRYMEQDDRPGSAYRHLTRMITGALCFTSEEAWPDTDPDKDYLTDPGWNDRIPEIDWSAAERLFNRKHTLIRAAADNLGTLPPGQEGSVPDEPEGFTEFKEKFSDPPEDAADTDSRDGDAEIGLLPRAGSLKTRLEFARRGADNLQAAIKDRVAKNSAAMQKAAGEWSALKTGLTRPDYDKAFNREFSGSRTDAGSSDVTAADGVYSIAWLEDEIKKLRARIDKSQTETSYPVPFEISPDSLLDSLGTLSGRIGAWQTEYKKIKRSAFLFLFLLLAAGAVCALYRLSAAAAFPGRLILYGILAMCGVSAWILFRSQMKMSGLRREGAGLLASYREKSDAAKTLLAGLEKDRLDFIEQLAVGIPDQTCRRRRLEKLEAALRKREHTAEMVEWHIQTLNSQRERYRQIISQLDLTERRETDALDTESKRIIPELSLWYGGHIERYGTLINAGLYGILPEEAREMLLKENRKGDDQ